MTVNTITGRFILLFLLFFLTGCGLSPGGKTLKESDLKEVSDTSVSAEMSTETKRDMIYVHVCGEVNQPGVYGFHEGARVFDAVEAAGGFTGDADQDSVNLAGLLEDEAKITVFSEKEEGKREPQEESDGKINLNTATLEQLMTLPGIGEKRAESILKLREEKGGFQKVEDLLLVEGIKEGIFAQIKKFVKV